MAHPWQGVNLPECSICLEYMAATHTCTHGPTKLFVLVAVGATDVCLPLRISDDISAVGSGSLLHHLHLHHRKTVCSPSPGDTLSASRTSHVSLPEKKKEERLKPSGGPVFGSSELRFFPPHPPRYLTWSQSPAARFRRIERMEREMI